MFTFYVPMNIIPILKHLYDCTFKTRVLSVSKERIRSIENANRKRNWAMCTRGKLAKNIKPNRRQWLRGDCVCGRKRAVRCGLPQQQVCRRVQCRDRLLPNTICTAPGCARPGGSRQKDKNNRVGLISFFFSLAFCRSEPPPPFIVCAI